MHYLITFENNKTEAIRSNFPIRSLNQASEIFEKKVKKISFCS